MSTAGGPNPQGQLSPDGLWRWDGRQWVPAATAPQPARPRGSRAWIWWLSGGCAVLLVLAIVGGIFGVTSLVSRFQSGGLSCLPPDFPTYPGARVTAENTYVGSGLPAGDTSQCRMTFSSGDDVATVTAWYSSALSSGDWTESTDSSTGTITFSRNSREQTVGKVQLLGAGQHTDIQVTLDT